MNVANRYFVNGGVDNNWGTTGNWSTTSGGAGGSAVPLATDDVFFDASSPNCTVNTSARVALTLQFTGYTNTITMTNNITVSGSVTLVAAMTISGAGTLSVNATSTLTSNGKTWPNAFTFGTGTYTVTLSGNWVNSGLVTVNGTNNTITLTPTAAETFTCSNGLTFSMTTGSFTGTAEVIVTGGTVTGGVSSGSIQTPLTFAGDVTISSSQTFRYGAKTLKRTSGTITATGSTLFISVSGVTLDTAGMSWNNVQLVGSAFTFTLASDLTVTGTLTIGIGTNSMIINGAAIIASGPVAVTHNSGTCSGTATLKLTETQTLTSSHTTGRFANPITIDASGKTVTFTNAFRCDLNALKCVAGTVVTGAGTWTAFGGTDNFARGVMVGQQIARAIG